MPNLIDKLLRAGNKKYVENKTKMGRKIGEGE